MWTHILQLKLIHSKHTSPHFGTGSPWRQEGRAQWPLWARQLILLHWTILSKRAIPAVYWGYTDAIQHPQHSREVGYVTLPRVALCDFCSFEFVASLYSVRTHSFWKFWKCEFTFHIFTFLHWCFSCKSVSNMMFQPSRDRKNEIMDRRGLNELPPWSLGDRVRTWTSRGSSVWSRCVVAASLCQKEPLEVVWPFNWNASWVPPLEVFWAQPTRRRLQGTPRIHWRDYISHLAWLSFGISSLRKALLGKGTSRVPYWACCHLDPTPDKLTTLDGWMDGLLKQ